MQANKKTLTLKALFVRPQWLVKVLRRSQLKNGDDVTGAKKAFPHTNPYIID